MVDSDGGNIFKLKEEVLHRLGREVLEQAAQRGFECSVPVSVQD